MELLRKIVNFHKVAEEDDEQQDILSALGLSDTPTDTPSGEGELPPAEDVEMGDVAAQDALGGDQPVEEEPQDPNRQGLIRVVAGAHLIYKRQTEDGTYEELWIYNSSQLKDELQIRQAILAGTDIPYNKQSSPDGKQTYDIWTAGNAEMLHIHGLQN